MSRGHLNVNIWSCIINSLSVTCDRSVIFIRYSGFLHQ